MGLDLGYIDIVHFLGKYVSLIFKGRIACGDTWSSIFCYKTILLSWNINICSKTHITVKQYI